MTCTRCVLSGDYLDLKEGVCRYCRYYADHLIEREVEKHKKPWVIYDIKKKSKGSFDCMLGLSGGVDSSYSLLLLREQGLRPFCFSVDNGFQTPEAQENIMRLVEGTKTPYYRYNIDTIKFRELVRAFVTSGVKNIEIPSDHLILATSYEMAAEYNIKTIISGGNWQTEGTMPEEYGYSARDLTHIKAIARHYGADTDGLPTISLLKYLYYRNIKRIKTVNILDYYDYNRKNAIKVLKKKYGYQEYGAKHEESQLTKWFQDCYLPTVHNLDKRRPHLSSLIHSGQMTREEAMKELEEPLVCRYLFKLPCGPQSHEKFKTNQYWERKWVKFFNVLKKYGYSR